MITEPRSDIVIVGAGPAGCAAGIAALRAGARVTVIEQARLPNHKVCGDAISNRAAAIVNDLCSRPDAVLALPHTEVSGAVAIFPDGTRIGRAYGREPGYIVPRNRLDAALRDALRGAGGELIDGVRVRSLIRDDRGRVRGVTADERRWPAEAVIACDGFASVASRSLGREIRRGAHLAFGITCYFSDLDAGPEPGSGEHYFEPDLSRGYCWVFPAVEGLANVGVYQRADELKRSGARLADLLDRFVARHVARFAGGRRFGPARVWSLPLAAAPLDFACPGLLLAGDAAYAIDPFTGEGIWQALHTGSLAGLTAVGALGASEGLDEARIRAYQRRLRRDIFDPSARRRRIESALAIVIGRRLYRWGIVRSLLRWGYGRGSLEMSKRVG
jgi:geranylgeranyl reductase family protein